MAIRFATFCHSKIETQTTNTNIFMIQCTFLNVNFALPTNTQGNKI